MGNNGWVAVHRSIKDNWVWEDKPFSKGQAWIDLILTANHEDVIKTVKGRPHKFEKGTVSMSQRKLADRWGWSRDKVIHFLHDLCTTGMIEKQSKDYTIIKLVNWDKFQVEHSKKQTTKQTIDQTSEQTTEQTLNNNDLTIKNNITKSEEPELAPVKVTRYPTGKYNNVFLSPEEAAKLQKEFPREASDMIEKLSEYMATKKTNYREDGHYAIILKWIREDRLKPKQQQAEIKPNKVNYETRQYTDQDITDIERKKLAWMFKED